MVCHYHSPFSRPMLVPLGLGELGSPVWPQQCIAIPRTGPARPQRARWGPFCLGSGAVRSFCLFTIPTLREGFFKRKAAETNTNSDIDRGMVVSPACAVQFLCYPSKHGVQSIMQHLSHEREVLLPYVKALSGAPRAARFRLSGVVENRAHCIMESLTRAFLSNGSGCRAWTVSTFAP